MALRRRFAWLGRHWYWACAAVLTGSFAALAVLWLVVTPMFQAPDEGSHFDYAYDLVRAGGILFAQDTPGAYAPPVLTMMGDADVGRLAFQPDQRVAPWYGTSEFFTRLRQDESRFANWSPNDPPIRPELIRLYPVGGYIPYALAMAPVRNDIVEEFYAARAMSVLASALGLLLWAAILPRLRVSRAVALGVLALVALFPLTSFVGSYVQPDGIAFTATALVLLAALRIRDGARHPIDALFFGLALAALYLVKVQYFAVAGLAAFALVLATYLRRRPDPGRALPTLLALLLPAIVAIALNRAIVGEGGGAANLGLRATVAAQSAGGPLPLLHYVAHETVAAWRDYFAGGATMLSYWGRFGWMDTPIVILNGAVTALVERLEVLGTTLAIVCIVLLAVRNATRLWRLARTRGAMTAIELLLRNPAFNGYLLFTLLMLALYVSSGNAFGAQGRDWYGWETFALLSAVWYAPAIVRSRRVRTLVRTAAMLVLALYVSVGAASAITSVENRYYDYATSRATYDQLRPDPNHLLTLAAGPRLTVDLGHLDTPVHGLQTIPPLSAPLVVPKAGGLSLQGWAFDPVALAPCAQMFASVDAGPLEPASYGGARGDVSAAFGKPALTNTGFTASWALGTLTPGRHELSLPCLSADGTTRLKPVVVATLEVRT